MNYNLGITVCAIGAISFLSYQCATPSSDSNISLEEVKEAIAESNAIYFQAFAKRDSSIFIERYAEDFCIMTPGSPSLCGSIAALQFFHLTHDEIKLRDGKFITTAVYDDSVL